MRGKCRQAAFVTATALVISMVLTQAPAFAYPRPGITELVVSAEEGSRLPAISGDGGVVAFVSEDPNLIANDTNDTWDVFATDRPTGITTRVSVGSGGSEANSFSSLASISRDGRYVSFVSMASNLVPGDTNQMADAFVHDLSTGTTERVSVASDGTESNMHMGNFTPTVSADGRYVAFTSRATNLVPEDSNGAWDVFLHDRNADTTELVSLAADESQGDADSGGLNGNVGDRYIALSADGRYVAFSSHATNLVPGDTNSVGDIFVRDRAHGFTERVSIGSGGTEANGASFDPSMSADGRHIAFWSHASNFVPNDAEGDSWDVFVYDSEAGITERVSVASDGTEADADSLRPSISADGRYVAFVTYAANLVPGDDHLATDIMVHDRATGATERVSVASDETPGNGSSLDHAISANGRHVVFTSTASNLVADDDNIARDVFVSEWGGDLEVLGDPTVVDTSEGTLVSGVATVAGTTLASTSDPADDSSDIGPLETAEAGADLTEATVIYRPENEDLLLRLDLSSLPSATDAARLPIVYGANLTVGATRYEVRALPAAITTTAPRAAHVALYKCEAICTEHAPLTGSFGSTGRQVQVSLPLEALGASEGGHLTDVRVFTAAGEALPGSIQLLDEIALSALTIPNARVELGRGTSASETAFDVTVALTDGAFSATAPSGADQLWLRVCIGDICGPASAA